jgi:hypothetical protein
MGCACADGKIRQCQEEQRFRRSRTSSTLLSRHSKVIASVSVRAGHFAAAFLCCVLGIFSASQPAVCAPAGLVAPYGLNEGTGTSAATYDSAAVRLYVNGVEVANQSQTAPLTASISPLRVGGTAAYGEYSKVH